MTEQAAALVQGMTIACPEGWQDKSMLVLSAERPGATGVSANLVVTREAIPGDLPADPAVALEAFVDRQLDAMRLALAGLVEVSRRHAAVAGSAAELRIDWVSDGVPIAQWITYAPTGERALMIATATAGRGDFAEAEAAFRAMLRTFRTG